MTNSNQEAKDDRILDLEEESLVCRFNQIFPYVTSLAASWAREILSGSADGLLGQRVHMLQASAAETNVNLHYVCACR